MTTPAAASSSNTHLMVPVFIFAVLLAVATIRGPAIISSAGIGSAVIVVAPLILATYALTVVVMAGRAGVDLSIGPLIGFINVGLIQLLAAGIIESPVIFFLYAMAVGVAYQLVMGLIIVFVRVQPIIVSLSGYLALVGLNLLILPRPGGVAPDWMMTWGAGTEIWSPVLVILIIATAAWYALANTAFFGHLRLMGSDERAAYTSGVKINIVRLGAHCIAGLYAGLAAICFTSLISSGDPTQGTTYTLMAVTALVLGGANLAGGRGGAFGSMLGALNIYLINYILGTFNFGRFQSFVTDLSYGSILVLSLLISLALPQIQRAARYISPLVFIAVLAVLAGGVIVHATMDGSSLPPLYATDTGEVVLDTGDTGAAPAANLGFVGAIIMLVVIGIGALIYLANLLIRYARAPMFGFIALVIVTALGLIFHVDPSATSEATQAAGGARDIAMTLQYLSLESLDYGAKTSAYDSFLISSAYAMIIALGIVILATLIIALNMPSNIMKPVSAPVALSALTLVVVAILAVVSIKMGAGTIVKKPESLFVALGGMLLFILAFSPLQNRIPQISNVYLLVLGLFAVGFVYFAASPESAGSASDYLPSVFGERLKSLDETPAYPVPGRLAPSAAEGTTVAQWAYSILVIVLLQFATWRAMARRHLLKQFWPFTHIVAGSAIAWGALFYSIGISLWNLIIVAVTAAITAPFIWRAFGSFSRSWSGESVWR